jgi:Tfp pilus assembly protein PilO
MPRNFDWNFFRRNDTASQTSIRLKIGVLALAVLNVIALLVFVISPGRSHHESRQESVRLNNQIATTRWQTTRLRVVSGKVQVGTRERSDFEANRILPKRVAYGQVIAEIQRMSKATGLEERDGVFTEEPIEGTADLSLLNITANYQGSYDNLMHFLHEADRSPMLLMLDNLQAAPEQKGGQIDVSIRFQAVIRDDTGKISEVQP